MKIGIESNILRGALKNAYFINGTAYAGKSTMVKRLAEKYGGVCLGENYHMDDMNCIDPQRQPNLCYFQTMRDWQAFISRTPEQYDDWIIGCSREAADLEIVKLLQLSAGGQKLFVDTNIPVTILKEISDYRRVAIMLCPQSMSVNRFFEREDREKQWIYQQIMQADDPEKALTNYRNCLMKVNSQEHYNEFEKSGFFVYHRTETSTVEDAIDAIETHFGLTQ